MSKFLRSSDRRTGTLPQVEFYCYFTTAIIFAASFLQGVNDGDTATLIRQIRMVVVIAVSCFLYVAILSSKKTQNRVDNTIVVTVLFLYFCVSIVSLIGHEQWRFGIWKLIEFSMYVGWSFYILKTAGISSLKITNFGMQLIFAFVLISILVSLVFYPNLAWNKIPSQIPYQLRGGILPINSNDLAMIFLVGILYFQIACREVKYNSWIVFIFLILLVATQNRTCLAFASIFMFFNIKHGWVIALLGTALIVTTPEVITNIMEAATRGDIQNILTGNGRLIIWSGAFVEMKDNLLLGSGFYVGHRFSSFQAGHLFIDQSNTLDNTFLDIFFDTGFLGLCLFVTFICVIFIRVFGKVKPDYANTYFKFLRWLLPFFVLDAFMGPTVQTYGLTLTIYSLLFLPIFSTETIGSSRIRPPRMAT
ncbi:O-antigen ligase family protein [Hirschia baltica]|uniref:O-antigen ligase-related domain-containing protein n=1 Tax=Hirschia baltica (strain ATCC 49814 / DSM 5838 / IFAM 1418) TaxID=582402 RepID=C6XK30_HIRBI|nr:O-antigen ligase family protein [Hirschia baltica]ACT59475.1 hypothetical protein Hbal_1789 [Hirschia baltica ATCC 49814]